MTRYGDWTCTDCDDTRDDVNPDVSELCNDIDDNCDGETDEDTAVDARTYYDDIDADGYGRPSTAITTCFQPDDTVLVGAYGADDGGRYSGVAYLVLGPISGTVQPSRADGTWAGESL